MTFAQELGRFDELLAAVHPEGFAALLPGLDDVGLQRMRDAVAPLTLRPDLEQLYRWHDGSGDRNSRVFGGKRLLPSAEILHRRQSMIDDLGDPPAWVRFTDGPGFLVSTLDVPGAQSLPDIWRGDTHDVGLARLHDSLEAMIGMLVDMLADDRETVDRRREIIQGALRWDNEYRLPRSPGSFVWPDPPEGTWIMQFEEGTPEPWLRSLGSSSEQLLPRGASHSVAELHAASAHGPVSGTIQGMTRRVAGPIAALGFTIDDGTGELRLIANDAVTVIGPVHGTRVEADVTLHPDGTAELVALRRSPESLL